MSTFLRPAVLAALVLLPGACQRHPSTGHRPLPAPATQQFVEPLSGSCWDEAGSWPQFMHDPLHSGLANVEFASTDLQLAWRFRPTEHIYQYQEGMSVWSSPVAGTVGGRALVFAGYCDRNVYAVDGVSGAKVWEFSPGGHVFATPALVRVAERALLVVAATNRSLYGLDAATGQRQWAFETVDWSLTQAPSMMSSPAVADLGGAPIVFVGVWNSDRSASRNLQAGELVALHAEGGSLLWRKRLASVPITSPVVARMGDETTVFVAAHHGMVYALRATDGAVLWESPLNESLRSSVSLGLAGGVASLFVGTRQHSVFALDPRTGGRRWRSAAGYWIDATPALVADGRPPVVVAGAYDRSVYAWQAADGRQRWAIPTGNYAYASPAMVTVQGQTAILQMSWDQGLYLLDAAGGHVLWKTVSGPLIWSHAFQGGSLWSSPVAARLGDRPAVLFPALDGTLYCYQ